LLNLFLTIVFLFILSGVISSYVRTYLRKRADRKRDLYLVKTEWGVVICKPRHFKRLTNAHLVEEFQTF